MINTMKINLGSLPPIEFTLDDFVYFNGGNRLVKKAIQTALKLLSEETTLQIYEKEYYEENDFSIYFNDKKITKRNVKLIYLDNFYSLLNELSFKAKTLLNHEVLSLKDNFDINLQMEQINDSLIRLDSIIGDNLSLVSEKLVSTVDYLTFDEILKKKLNINLLLDDNQIPISVADPSYLLELTLTLIERYTEKTGDRCWVVIDGLSNLVAPSVFENFIEKLSALSHSKKLIHFFLFNCQTIPANLLLDSEKIILMFQDIIQLPPLDILRSSIMRHYPGEFSLNDNELLEAIMRISPSIGNNYILSNSISPKDVILLVVLKDLLGDISRNETSFQPLSSSEKAFLLNRS